MTDEMGAPYPCPCCGFLTMDEPPGEGSYDICPVCFWEDDPVQYHSPDYVGGANPISLEEARENFRRFGAFEERWKKKVRPPKPEEIPPERRGPSVT